MTIARSKLLDKTRNRKRFEIDLQNKIIAQLEGENQNFTKLRQAVAYDNTKGTIQVINRVSYTIVKTSVKLVYIPDSGKT